jgi:hypothetical protein
MSGTDKMAEKGENSDHSTLDYRKPEPTERSAGAELALTIARWFAWQIAGPVLLIGGIALVCFAPFRWRMSGPMIVVWVFAGFACVALVIWLIQNLIKRIR